MFHCECHLVAENLSQEDHQGGPAARGKEDKREDELVQLEFLQRLFQLKLLVVILQVNQTGLRWDWIGRIVTTD